MISTRIVPLAALGFFLLGPSCAPSVRSALAAAPHPAQSPRVPAVARSVEVEITDTPHGGAARTSHYAMAMVDDTGWSRISARLGTERLLLQARSDRGTRSGAVVRVEVHRSDMNGSDLDLEESTVFFAGRRSVLGHLDRPDGSATEVAIVTR